MRTRFVAACVLLAYGVILVKVVVFKGLMPGRPPGRPGGAGVLEPVVQTRQVIIRWGTNFVPFKTIGPQLLGRPRVGVAVANLAANTVLFVPLGVLAPIVYRRLTWRTVLALAVTVGLAMEALEWAFNVGIVDVDDVILNALGVMIGYRVFKLIAMRQARLLHTRLVERRA